MKEKKLTIKALTVLSNHKPSFTVTPVTKQKIKQSNNNKKTTNFKCQTLLIYLFWSIYCILFVVETEYL